MNKHYLVKMRISVRDDGKTFGSEATLWEVGEPTDPEKMVSETRLEMDQELGSDLSDAAMAWAARKGEELKVDKLWKRIERLAASDKVHTNGLETKAIAKALLELKKQKGE